MKRLRREIVNGIGGMVLTEKIYHWIAKKPSARNRSTKTYMRWYKLIWKQIVSNISVGTATVTQVMNIFQKLLYGEAKTSKIIFRWKFPT